MHDHLHRSSSRRLNEENEYTQNFQYFFQYTINCLLNLFFYIKEKGRLPKEVRKGTLLVAHVTNLDLQGVKL